VRLCAELALCVPASCVPGTSMSASPLSVVAVRSKPGEPEIDSATSTSPLALETLCDPERDAPSCRNTSPLLESTEVFAQSPSRPTGPLSLESVALVPFKPDDSTSPLALERFRLYDALDGRPARSEALRCSS